MPFLAKDATGTNQSVPTLAETTQARDFSPGYTAYTAGTATPTTDPDGQLITRGAIHTDEGSYRANFSNSSVAASIGTCTFTNGSPIVTGTGFDSHLINRGDYVFLDADTQVVCAQVDLIEPTKLTLVENYTGAGGSGAASRQILLMDVGSGASITVQNGQLKISLGTTANAMSDVDRLVDVPPIIKIGGLSLSQRIANQDIVFGFYEDVLPARYYAWFRFNGTDNTKVICESGWNASQAPSSYEIETSTITIPSGQTTATSLRYRVELLKDRILFYINDLPVCQNFKVVLRSSDELASGLRGTNAATPPASSTDVFLDYDSAINFNSVLVDNSSLSPTSLSRIDGTSVYTSTISAVGNSPAIDTQSFHSIVIQLGGVWWGNIQIEGSNDQSADSWRDMRTLSLDGIMMDDNITSNGHYVLVSTTRYIRISTVQLTGSILVSIVGRDVECVHAIDRVAAALDQSNGVRLSIATPDIQKDKYGTLFLSDAPDAKTGGLSLLNSIACLMDTSGYNSISLQISGTWVATLTFQTSNDGSRWDSVSGYNSVPGTAAVSTTTANGSFVLPVIGKYFRIQCTAFTSGVATAVAYLRTQPCVPLLSSPLVAAVQSGTWTAQIGNTANTTPILANPGTPTENFLTSAASTNATSVKASAGTVYNIAASNINAAIRYLKLYNKASAPTVGTDIPVLTLGIPATGAFFYDCGPLGHRFGTGIAYAITTVGTDADTTATAASEQKIAISYL